MADPVHVLRVGAFGKAAGEHLRWLRDDTIQDDADEAWAPEAWPAARVNILTAWRPVSKLCQRLDEMTHAGGPPFLAVVQDGRGLSAGPVVVKGQSCWDCWARRSLQHDARPEARKALWEHYDENAGVGPHGFLESTALIGAAVASSLVDALDAGAPVAGLVWHMDLLSREVSTSVVCGIHGCPRCGLGRSEDARSFAAIQDALAYLWK